MAKGRRARPKGPGVMYTALTIVMFMMVSVLALASTQPPPPTIAEFAPQAQEVIDDAPSEQSSEFGAGADGVGEGDLGTDPVTGEPIASSTPPPIEVSRVRRCIGDPPRQTEDPQSPPCVPYWDGDNGGDTYRGVTGSTIRVGYLATDPRAVAALQAYFNSRYELYGRQIELVGVGGGNTCEERKAAARGAYENRLFAVADVFSGNGPACFAAEAARLKMISISEGPQFSEQTQARLRPYLWSYAMGEDKVFTAIGEMICKRLKDGNAEYSPDPRISTSQRKFGLVGQSTIRDIPVDTSPIDRALSKCGVTIPEENKHWLSDPDDAGFTNHQGAQAAMLDFQTKGITTVIMLGIVFVSQNISAAADSQGYHPEWIFSTYGGMDINTGIQAFWPHTSQRQSIIGVNVIPPNRPWSMEPAYWAAKEVDPSFPADPAGGPMPSFARQYRALMVLVSGIQMAGPELTPQTLESALRRTKFPYPADDHTKSGDVSFRSGHSMTDTVSEFWWDDTAQSPVGYQSTGARGAVCYVDEASRHQLGSWPPGPPKFHQGPCYTGPS